MGAEPTHPKVPDLPERDTLRQTVPVDGEDDDGFQSSHVDLPPSYEASTAGAGASAPGVSASASASGPPTNTNGTVQGATARSSVSSEASVSAGLLHRGSSSRHHAGAGSTGVVTSGYVATDPMNWDDPSRWDKYSREPGCCGSSSGGCCFSSRGGCCFSDREGCCCSDNQACCFSNHQACCFSDNKGCCCSDSGGGGCATNGGCCCSTGPDPEAGVHMR